MKIQKDLFGQTKSGEKVFKYTLENDNGMSVSIIEFGCAITSLMVPDKEGKVVDVVCGYDTLQSYEEADGYLGAVVGRFANRIAKGRFTLNGKVYTLYQNDNQNHLHGGKCGFSHKVWASESNCDEASATLNLRYTSPDMEEGYPGKLDVSITYTLTNTNALSIRYEATTDKTTVLNLTNHAYFNLGGFNSGKIFEHTIQSSAISFLETDKELIPTGKIISVRNTPLDFLSEKTIGRDFDTESKYLKNAGGYDHCLVFPDNTCPTKPQVTVKDKASGRIMEVYTDQPCVQFYSANFLNNEKFPLKGGYPQSKQIAFCLETQRMPDSMNHPGFTDCTLEPGKSFISETIYKFKAE